VQRPLLKKENYHLRGGGGRCLILRVRSGGGKKEEEKACVQKGGIVTRAYRKAPFTLSNRGRGERTRDNSPTPVTAGTKGKGTQESRIKRIRKKRGKSRLYYCGKRDWSRMLRILGGKREKPSPGPSKIGALPEPQRRKKKNHGGGEKGGKASRKAPRGKSRRLLQQKVGQKRRGS